VMLIVLVKLPVHVHRISLRHFDWEHVFVRRDVAAL
jgi:hypothetical protein